MIFPMALVFLLLGHSPAMAYVDPGAGSLLIQAVLAVLLGGGLGFRGYFRKIFNRLRGRSDDDHSSNDK